jgi:hypothetical protein
MSDSKKPKRKKPEPKFSVGQVVTDTANKENGILFRVREIRTDTPAIGIWDGWVWHDERLFRPLTAKEIGPRRKRG